MIQITKAIKARYRLAICAFVLFAAAVALRVVWTEPKCLAEVLVHLDVKKKSTSPEAERLEVQEIISFIQTAFSIMKSDLILAKVVQESGYGEQEPSEDDRGRAPPSLRERVRDLRKHIQTEHIRFTNLGIIRVEDAECARAVAIANGIVHAFQEWQAQQTRQEIERIDSFIDQRTEIAMHALNQAEESLKEYLEEKGMRLTDAGPEGRPANIPSLIREYLAADEGLESITGDADETVLSEALEIARNNAKVEAWLDQLSDYETERANLLRYYTPAHKRVKRLDQDVKAAEDSIRSTLRSLLTDASDPLVERVHKVLVRNEKARALQRYAEGLKAERWAPQSDLLPQHDMERERFERRVDLLEKTYSALVLEKESNPIVYAKDSLRLTVVSPATSSMAVEVDSRWVLLALGLVSALIFSLALTVAVAQMNR